MYIQRQLTLDELKPVLREIADIDTKDFGPMVNHRIYLEKSKAHMSTLLSPLVQEYNAEYKWPELLSVFRPKKNLVMEDYWVNFMGPGTCTPIHNHGGVMSWCLWIRVPYTRESELQATPWIPVENNINGDFAFHTVTDRGIATIPLSVDQSWEGRVAMWPAYLNHSVFPFYSTDEIRVSVAGNFWFDV